MNKQIITYNTVYNIYINHVYVHDFIQLWSVRQTVFWYPFKIIMIQLKWFSIKADLFLLIFHEIRRFLTSGLKIATLNEDKCIVKTEQLPPLNIKLFLNAMVDTSRQIFTRKARTKNKDVLRTMRYSSLLGQDYDDQNIEF